MSYAEESRIKLLTGIKAALHTKQEVVLLEGDATMSQNFWEQSDRPHTIKLVESKLVDGYHVRVYICTAYGRVILVRGSDTLNTMASGKQMAALPEVIALDIEYYGLHKYIWE